MNCGCEYAWMSVECAGEVIDRGVEEIEVVSARERF